MATSTSTSTSIDNRQPGTYDGVSGPQVLREIMTRDMEELSGQDKQAIKDASGAFVRWVAGGLVVGSGLGMLFAMRGRYHPTQWRKLPKIFPQGFSGPINRDALGDRIGFGIRLVAFSTAGLVLGQSFGFALGSWRSTQLLKREGNYENIERVMNKVRKDVQHEYEQRRAQGPEGTVASSPIPSQQRRRLQGQPDDRPFTASQEPDSGALSSDTDFYGRNRADALQNSRLSRTFERDTRDTSAGAVKGWDEAPFAGDDSSSSTYGGSFPSTSAASSERTSNADARSTPAAARQRSRWEELRGTRDSKDSAWEKIRQDNARQTYNGNRSDASSADDALEGMGVYNDRPPSEGFSEEQKRGEEERRKRMDKERQRIEYEKMFEKESRGEDSL